MVGSGREGRSRLRVVAAAICLGLLLEALVLWVAAGAGGSKILAPAASLRVNGEDARAKARMAEQLLTQPTAGNRAEALRLSRAALLRDPTVVTAARSAGLAAALDGQLAKANQRMDYAMFLSRRDLPTLLYLIEDRVQKGDVAGSLYFYDVALRSTRNAGPVLIPVLASAIADDNLARVIPAYIVAHRPPWTDSFLSAVLQGRPEWANVATLFSALGRRHVPVDRRVATQAIRSMVDAGAIVPARQVYATYFPDGVSERLRDGSFANEGAGTPFEWELANEGERSAARSSSPTGTMLSVRVGRDDAAMVARQLLLLAPGRYRLRATLDQREASAAVAPIWALACSDRPAEPFARIAPTQDGLGWNGTFVVPPSCAAQWLTLSVPAGDEPVAFDVRRVTLDSTA